MLANRLLSATLTLTLTCPPATPCEISQPATLRSAMQNQLLPRFGTPRPLRGKIHIKKKRGGTRAIGIHVISDGGGGGGGGGGGTPANTDSGQDQDSGLRWTSSILGSLFFIFLFLMVRLGRRGLIRRRGTVSLSRCPHQSSVPGASGWGDVEGGDGVRGEWGRRRRRRPPPDANELAREATGLLQVPVPLVHMGAGSGGGWR